MKITVLGAGGGIGQALSLLLKTQLPTGSLLSLYDLAPMTPGVGTDLSHIPTAVKVVGYTGDDPQEALLGSDLVLISAGIARKPGMTRADLFNINADIIANLISSVAKHCPKAIIGVITNPVNTTVAIAKQVLLDAGVYDPRKLFGVTTLDTIRSETFIAELKNLKPEEVDIPVIGGHSGTTILPLLSHVKNTTFSEKEVASLTNRIQNAGTEVVEAKAGAGSATLSMGFAAYRFADAIIQGLQGKQVTHYAYVDNKDAPAPFFAQAVQLGKEGIEKILPYENLSSFEQTKLNEMLPTLQEDIKKGLKF